MTKDLGLVPILLLTSTVMLVSDALWPVRRELWRRWRRVTSGDIWWRSPCVVELQQSSWTGTVYPIFSLVFLIVQGSGRWKYTSSGSPGTGIDPWGQCLFFIK